MGSLLARVLKTTTKNPEPDDPVELVDIHELAELIDAYMGKQITGSDVSRAICHNSPAKNVTTKGQTLVVHSLLRLHREGYRLVRPK